MRWAVLFAIALGACGGPKLQERSAGQVSKHLPATLEAERPRDGEPRTVKVRVHVDAGARAQARWREEITDQIDYASQLLTPLCGIRLAIDTVQEWTRAGEPGTALGALAELDRGEGDDVAWVIGYITPGDTAAKAMSELGSAEPLGKHVVIKAWAEKPETDALVSILPDLKEAERVEVIGAHRRHKQTAVLLHMLATSLGAIAETDPAWLKHPTYSPKMTGFSERNRELMGLAIDDRLAGGTPQTAARKLVDAIEKSPWGGWITADQDEVTKRLRNVLDAARAGKTAADVPAAAYDQYSRIKELARRGKADDARAELDNLLVAYPGNAAMHQLRCEIFLRSPGVADKATRTACARASEVAPGDPSPHIAVAEALARTGDLVNARAELSMAEAKIPNLKAGAAEAWKRVIGMYQGMGALTWTEEAIAKAGLERDPVAQQVAQVRARYGVPKGARIPPDQEPALVAAVRASLDLVYGSKFAEAEKAITAAEHRWPNAAGLAGARCDLAFRQGQVDAARAACARAIAIDPKASWALYMAGVIALRDTSAAGSRAGIDRLKQAIAADPELGQAWRTLAKAYARAKDRPALEQLGKDYAARFGQPLPP
jgi:tetratricopeptide (TPR) repeat protein